MRYWLLFTLTVFTINFSQAQCISGNCYTGSGAYIYPSGAKFVGQFIKGKIGNKGNLYFSNGDIYEGEWKNQYREGEGIITFANGEFYSGDFVKGKFEGFGTLKMNNGDQYAGNWQQDQMHGKGTYYYDNGDRYVGDFVMGMIEGFGKLFYENGARYEGEWSKNKKNGKGIFVKSSGEKIVGEWSLGKILSSANPTNQIGKTKTETRQPAQSNTSQINRNCNASFCGEGLGYYIYRDGSKWTGHFVKGKPQGKGTCDYANGDRYEGEWLNHAPHGKGIMYFKNGKVHGAVWSNGTPIKLLQQKQKPIYNANVNIDESAEVKVWAVVIGVAGYTHMPVLKYTDDDAYQIYAFLKSPEGGAIPDNQIEILVDDRATRKNILKAMNNTFLKADKNDVVLLYFSGHGLAGSFLPFDYDGYRNKLMHEEIQALLAKSQAKHKICFADACHSGNMLASKGPSRAAIRSFYNAFDDSDGGTALLLSSKGDEYSLEDLGLRQGIYSHFLMKGLKGLADTNNNKIVSITELFNYVHKEVTRYTNYVQTPTLTGSFDPDMPVAAIR